jgi:predicted MFS family arabinose efflux permease
MFIALELGIMTGSLSTLVAYQNTKETVYYTFTLGALFALFATIYLFWHLRTKESKY